MSDTLGLKRPRFRGEVTKQSADTTMSSRLNRRNQGARSPTHSTTASCIDTNKDHEKGDSSTVKRFLTRARWTCRRSAVVALMAGSGGIWIMGNLWKFSRTLSPGRESSSVVASLPLPSLRINTARSTGPHPRVINLYPEPQVDFDQPMYKMLKKLSYPVFPMTDDEFWESLADSREYRHNRADPAETENCKAQYDWQLHSFPSCNHLHERELQKMSLQPDQPGHPIRLVANGYWRDVWILPSNRYDDHLVLKTIRYMHDYTERNYDRHRRDALAMERLTDQPYIVDIYAFCGNSGVFEFAGGGDIGDVIFPYDSSDEDGGTRHIANVSSLERLHIGTSFIVCPCVVHSVVTRGPAHLLLRFPAVQVSMGLAAVHNSEKEGRPAIAHTDISPGQFVRVDGVFKLNDFNRARFLLTNTTDGSLCTFEVGNNPGMLRSGGFTVCCDVCVVDGASSLFLKNFAQARIGVQKNTDMIQRRKR